MALVPSDVNQLFPTSPLKTCRACSKLKALTEPFSITLTSFHLFTRVSHRWLVIVRSWWRGSGCAKRSHLLGAELQHLAVHAVGVGAARMLGWLARGIRDSESIRLWVARTKLSHHLGPTADQRFRCPRRTPIRIPAEIAEHNVRTSKPCCRRVTARPPSRLAAANFWIATNGCNRV